MKRITILVAFCLLACGVRAQSFESMRKSFEMPKDSLPYRLHPTLPEFNILLTDSVSVFNTKDIPTGRPAVIMFFSPDCHHFQDAMKLLLEHMDEFKGVDFYMVSNARNVSSLREFIDKYQIASYPNIKALGQDVDFFFITFYGARYLPDFAVYDRHKKLVKLFESNVTVDDLVKATHTK